MATIPTTSKISTSADEENRTNYETDLSTRNTDDEIHADTSTWSPADKKKLQYMTKSISMSLEREPPFKLS